MEQKVAVRFELKQLLKEKGLTYEEFGSKFTPELDKGTVSRLVHRKSITFEMLERIMNALDMEPEEITKIIRAYK